MKKQFAVLFAFIVGCSSVLAGRTDPGTWVTGLDFAYDTTTGSGSSAFFDLEVGRFSEGGHLFGGSVMYDGDDYCKMFSLGPVYEFNFYDTGESPTVFYVGALVHLAHMIADFGDADDATALLFGGRIGMRFFLTETTAFDVRLNGYFATDDIYADDGDVSPTNVSITAGFKFFL